MRRNTSIDLLAKIDPSGGLFSCWPYVGSWWHKDGYGYIRKDGKAKLTHRWSYEHHYNVELNPDVKVRHKCDNPACCNPLHLEIGTQGDNVRDMHKRGRFKKGKMRHPWTLSDQQIKQIHELHEKSLSQRAIAKEVGCSQAVVCRYLHA